MQVEQLLAIEAIKQLKARYFRLMDTKQWAEWEQVFSEDARLQWGPGPRDFAEGRSAIVAAVSEALRDATTCHHGNLPEIELIDADHARGIWAMFDRVEHPDYLLEGFGHYHEEYVRERDGWRIRSSRLTRLHRDFASRKGSGA